MPDNDAQMDGVDDTLVSRRSRRSTAGNRMAAALAEITLEELTKDAEDDVDFVNEKDEADMFESDFESTDEEADTAVAEAGEKEVDDEEKKARKAARSRLEKATKSAQVKQQVTFNPTAVAGPSTPKPGTKPKRRVSLGFVIDAATGEVTGVDHGVGRNNRKSQRKHTMLNTSATVQRLQKSEEKKAAVPRKQKTETRTLTQAELIACALDNEEGNIIEHRDYLKREEEKRKRARITRTTIDGPVIRWISKTEKEKVVIQPPAPPPPLVTPQTARSMYSYAYPGYSSLSGSTPYGQTAYNYHNSYTRPFIYTTPQQSSTSTPTTFSSGTTQTTQVPVTTATTSAIQSAANPQATSQEKQPTSITAESAPVPPPATVSAPPIASTASSLPAPYQYLTLPLSTSTSPYTSAYPSSTHLLAPQPITPTTQTLPAPIEKILTVEKNYVVHELGQFDGVRKPDWSQTMYAMFGDHVQWEEVRILVGKNRPLARPKQQCPVTGKPARYLDPRTGVPFADQRGFDVLSDILKHNYVWNPALGCYVARRDEDRGGDTTDLDNSMLL